MMNENNIQIEQQSGIEQQSEAQAKRLLAYYSYLRKSQKMTYFLYKQHMRLMFVLLLK